MKTVFSGKKQLGGIHYTTVHTGKMECMQSLSTSCTNNELCLSRRNIKGSVCEKCFSFRQHARFGSDFTAAFVKNGEILSSRLLNDDEIPYIIVPIFRLESFGDLINTTHFVNLINIAKHNPQTMFSLWTKNLQYVRSVLRNISKPDNMLIIASSIMINKTARKPSFADKVFTVYDKKYAKEHNVSINCGDSKCILCRRCYTKDSDIFINELLK